MSARDRFAKARSAVIELAQIQALISTGGDDWKPESVGKSGNGDPTANRAVYNVDVWGVRLKELRDRETELLEVIGRVLVDIELVRGEFGNDYADILDQRYIDCLPWSQVELHGRRVKLSTGKKRVKEAFAWLDK
jgi:hypothetical protein